MNIRDLCHNRELQKNDPSLSFSVTVFFKGLSVEEILEFFLCQRDVKIFFYT
jgi:hypothetical protein